MIQYVNILTKNGKSLLFREYGTTDVDRDLLTNILSSFLEFKDEINQSEIKHTQTETFKYFYSIINRIIIVVCSDLDDDDSNINSKILSIRTKFIEKYDQTIYDESWGENRATFDDFKKIIDDIILGGIKVSIIGFGGIALLQLICGNGIKSKYVPMTSVDITLYNGVTRSIMLWNLAGTESFRSLWENVLEASDIVLIVTDSTFENISRYRYNEMLYKISDKNYKNKSVIGIANCQDMPNRLTPEFCEKIIQDKGIEFYGIDAFNPVYREKIVAILTNAILKISNGKEDITCNQCGNMFTRDFFKILKQTKTRVKDLFYCSECNFPLRYIYYEDCINIRTFNPLITSHGLNRKDPKLNKRFKKQWIDYFGIIFKGKEQVYSNIDLAYLEVEDKVDYIAESFFSGNLNQKILDIYSPFIEKCNFPRRWEQPLSLPKCFSLEKGDLTFIIIGVLSNSNLILRKIAFFIKNLFYIYDINIGKMDKSSKNRIRNFIDFNITYIKNGDFNFLRENLSYLLEKRRFIPSKNSQLSVDSRWNLKLKQEIWCPMCGASGKKNFKLVEDKSKIMSYISIVPIYAKKHICKRCGYVF